MAKEILEYENFYGHLKRLEWIKSKIIKNDTVLEVGCGTGSFITTPLILSKVDAYGIDIGTASIKEAKRIAKINGISEERYRCMDITDLSEKYDVVICSEVLEHIMDNEQPHFVNALCKKVKTGGKLIVTVPNGMGSYEIGQKYFKEKAALVREIREPFLEYYYTLKKQIQDRLNAALKNDFRRYRFPNNPGGLCMSPDDSPHVQWFSAEDILNLIMPKGFRLIEFTGSSMFSGIIINTFLKPNRLLCSINNKLGSMFPYWASGYYFLFYKVS